MEPLNSYISLFQNISLLIAKVEQKTEYTSLSSEVKNGGVYVKHPSGVLVCYATILQGGALDNELYNHYYKVEILLKKLEAALFSIQLEKQTLEELQYHKLVMDEQKAISNHLEQQRDEFEEYLKYRQQNISKPKKIKRKRTIKCVEILLVTIATCLLTGFGMKGAKEIVTKQQQYALIMDYVGEDTNILNEHTSRINNNKDYQFHNDAIATAIVETGKNPWPLLSDLLSDMWFDKTNNFPSVVDYLNHMDYFPYDFETLVITANARANDGSCDFDKLARYIRERAVYIITDQKKEAMTDKEKEELYSFLNYFHDYIGEVKMIDSSKGMSI